MLAINIQNTISPKQVNTQLSINLVDCTFLFPIILWSFRYFGGLSGNSSLSGKSRHPSHGDSHREFQVFQRDSQRDEEGGEIIEFSGDSLFYCDTLSVHVGARNL